MLQIREKQCHKVNNRGRLQLIIVVIQEIIVVEIEQ